MKKFGIRKLLLTLNITFASCQIYWVFKEAEIQAIGLKLYVTKKEERDHQTPLVRWSLHKYKCLWGVGGKDRGSSL